MYNYRAYPSHQPATVCIFNATVLLLNGIIVYQAAIDLSWRSFLRLCFNSKGGSNHLIQRLAGIAPARLSLAVQTGALTINGRDFWIASRFQQASSRRG